MKFRVTVHASPDLELMHGSFVLSGLAMLALEGEIGLSIDWREPGATFAIAAEVERVSDGARRRVCFDFHDRSYFFSKPDLLAADVYFKRSTFLPDVEKLLPQHAAKVRAFGPIFALASRPAPFAIGVLARTFEAKRKARAVLRDVMRFVQLPPTSAYEAPPSDQPRILLQTRLWTDSEVTGEPAAAEINAQRTSLVKALRAEFGDRFVGGLVATPLAREKHPELVCARDTSRSAYLAEMHRCSIGVYTDGLHHSLAWKLGEYLASSLAIVAPPFRNEFAEPFRAGVNFHPFTSNDECLERCTRLLENESERRAMQLANRDYYFAHGRPPAQIARCLERAFEPA